MPILPIIKYPSKVLRQKAKKITDPLDLEVQKLIKNMAETLRVANGMGLAAPQVGKLMRLCIIENENNLYVLVNPKITAKSKKRIILEEGCLSFPKKFLKIERPEEVKVRFLDEKGKQVKIKARGLFARAIQHEIDHLDGKLFIDYKK